MMSWRLTECSLEQADYGTNYLHSEEQQGTRGALDVSYSYLFSYVIYLSYCLRFATKVLGGLESPGLYFGAPFHLVVGGKRLLCFVPYTL